MPEEKGMHQSHLHCHLIKAEKKRNCTRMGGDNMWITGDLIFRIKQYVQKDYSHHNNMIVEVLV
jgi:hypothetical protein